MVDRLYLLRNLKIEKNNVYKYIEETVNSIQKISARLFFIVFVCVLSTISFFFEATAKPVSFTDSSDNRIVFQKIPVRVVSLSPGITEMIFAIGADDSVVGITYHDTWHPDSKGKFIVGGFFSPSLEKIRNLSPDVVFYSSLQESKLESFIEESEAVFINLENRSISGIPNHLRLLGKAFEKKQVTEKVIGRIENQIDRIREKTRNIPDGKRKRTIRLMGRDQVMTPGDSSFQNEYIRLAGGIPPRLNKEGKIVSISLQEWKAFNPEIIYGCGGDRKVADKFFQKPGWKDVDAVKNGQIYYFPCALTCRASTHAGHFVSWLAGTIYPEYFAKKHNQIDGDKFIGSREVSVDLPYVQSARIVESMINDFVHRTLLVKFQAPMGVISTLQGADNKIEVIGNNYSPPPTWSMYHHIGLEKSRKQLHDVLSLDPKKSSLLFTGADMNNLAIVKKNFREMTVYALVTGGVETNAVRMSKDTGAYYEPGTINVIVMTNMKLSRRAMTRVIISATEAKTAAIVDLDIRSSYSGLLHQATGTGTDNVLVVEGTGKTIDNAGGHSKMGELIAKAVYDGVVEALYLQNGLYIGRNPFRRIKERKLSLYGLANLKTCGCDFSRANASKGLETLLMNPRYRGFFETALAVSDFYERGLISDVSAYRDFCRMIRDQIGDGKAWSSSSVVVDRSLPEALRLCLDAMIKGAVSAEIDSGKTKKSLSITK